MKDGRNLEILEKMSNIVMQSEDIPEEAKKIIENIFTKVENEYYSLRHYYNLSCNNATISEYLQSTKSEFENELSEIGENRKNAILKELEDITNSIISDLEEEIDDDTLDERNNEYREGISELGKSHNTIDADIMDKLQEALMDIQEYQRGILESIGYDPRKIENMDYEAKEIISRIVDKNRKDVYEIMQEDTKQLKKKILDLYEELQEGKEEGKEEEKEEEKNVDEKPSFKESLYSGMSLNEQNLNAKKIIKNIENANIGRQSNNKNQYANLFR